MKDVLDLERSSKVEKVGCPSWESHCVVIVRRRERRGDLTTNDMRSCRSG